MRLPSTLLLGSYQRKASALAGSRPFVVDRLLLAEETRAHRGIASLMAG